MASPYSFLMNVYTSATWIENFFFFPVISAVFLGLKLNAIEYSLRVFMSYLEETVKSCSAIFISDFVYVTTIMVNASAVVVGYLVCKGI